jgi:ParB family chromosome partitioning protein
MSTTDTASTEYRNLPLDVLTESSTNPRRIFDEAGLKELAESIRTRGVLEPVLVRPTTGRGFEIVAGARRFRAAKLADVATIPVRIKSLTDAEALETQLVENLQRQDVHPLDEAQGFRALLNLEEPKYGIEQIAAKTGKSPAYVAQRLKLTELAPAVIEALAKDEIGVGHALLLAKLQKQQQEEALPFCFQEQYGNARKSKPILLPVRQLQQWIEHNILLILKEAPFDKKDTDLVPSAGSCLDCSKRTGHNKLLFADVRQDACTDPTCYSAKVAAHVQKTIASKPKLVQISTSFSGEKEGSTALPRNKYVEILQNKPEKKEQRDWPQYKSCKFVTEAIVTEGAEKGEIRRICANPECSVHHAKKQPTKADAAFKAEQDKRRREEALAQATGLRVLSAIVEAVPVRLVKRDLLFLAERLATMLDERRLSIVVRQHRIGKAKNAESLPKLLSAFFRKSDEGILGRLLVEMVILQSTQSQTEGAKVLRSAADLYKIDIEAITTQVKREFAAKEKAKTIKMPTRKQPTKAAKQAQAA